MTRHASLAVLLSACLLPSSLAAQQACQPETASAHLRSAQSDLLRQPTQEMQTEVSPLLQAKITALKSALITAVNAGMQCMPAAADAPAIERSLAKLLGANEPEKPLPSSANDPASKPELATQSGSYGAELKISVSTPANAPSLRAVKVSYGIECGSDTMLLLYTASSGRWQQTLAWQSGTYSEVSGAFGDWLLYAVIPGNNPSDMRIAVAHGTAWCTSNMSGFKIDLLTPVQGKSELRVIWHREEGYRRESDPRIIPRPDGFELRADVSTIETEQVIRKGIFRYRVLGDKVERIRPIALDGRGFVDAWLQAPWSDARQWSLPAGIPTFARVHDQFERSSKDASVTYAYGPVRACLMQGRYSVEIDSDPVGPAFYTIQEGPDSYTMVDYSTTQDERCSGPDLMKKH